MLLFSDHLYVHIFISKMNLLKSIFISTFPVVALLVAIYSGRILLQEGITLAYVGLFLASFPIVLFFLLIFINKRPRTSEKLMPWTVVIVAGSLMTFWGEPTVYYLAILTDILWSLYVSWYSKFDNRTNNTILRVGQQLPNFQLEDDASHKISNKQFIGNPSIYLFYRGNWCPLCVAQIEEIASQYKELEKRGVNMVLISPQPHKLTAKMAKKFKVGFHFLVDKGNQVAKQLHIVSENGLPFGFQVLGYDSDTVMPTVIITDKNGKILFADLTDNYRVRPEPSTFFEILDK